MPEQEQDRTEDATPFKIEEAKKRGQVMKSLEFNSFFLIMTFLGVLVFWGKDMMAREVAIGRWILDRAHLVDFQAPHLIAWFKTIVIHAVYGLSPLFVLLIVIAVLTNLVQTGPIFTFFPLKPDIQRINPVAGFKRMFSLKMLFEALKSIVKLCLFGAVLYFVIAGLLPKMTGLMYADPDGYARLLMGYAAELIFKLAMVLLIIAMLDFLYTRWDYANKLKMSRREVKEEVKRREGDPHVRARLRELQKEAAKRGKAVKKVPDADVLITNPTHFAVALLYQRERMTAPQVIAKGANETAQQMKQIARAHNVPVVENKTLARALFKEAALDAPIPEAQYAHVARILAWVYRRRDQLAPQGGRA